MDGPERGGEGVIGGVSSTGWSVMTTSKARMLQCKIRERKWIAYLLLS